MSLCIIAPCRDSSPGPCRTAFAQLCAAYAVYTGKEPAIIDSWLSSNIADVRAKLAARAILENADVFVWIDDDIIAKRADLARLLEAIAIDGVDVVSGRYTQKKLGAAEVCGHILDGRVGPLIECESVGFGFLAMRRHVLESVVAEKPFSRPTEGIGEDDAFSAWWRARDGRLWLHTDVMLGHVGQHIFRAGES